MMQLSDESLTKVASCLEISNENRTINEFRKCCYRVGNTIVKNDLHRFKAYNLSLTITEKAVSMIIFDLDRKSMLQNIAERKINGTLRENDVMVYETEEQSLTEYKGRLAKFRKLSLTREIQLPIEKEMLMLRKLLKKASYYISSTNFLRIFQSNLNAEFLEVLKEHTALISSATVVVLAECVMQWTSDELLQFLKIFKSLKRLKILAEFKESIITNEHLTLVSDEMIVIDYDLSEELYFPDIAPDIIHHWTVKRTNFVVFEGIPTELTYSDIMGYMETKIDKARPANDDWFRLGGRHNNFGVLKFHEDDLRKIVLDQSKRNFDWKINTEFRREKRFTVTRTGIKYSFTVDIPYQAPHFQQLLESVECMRDSIVSNVGMQEHDLTLLDDVIEEPVEERNQGVNPEYDPNRHVEQRVLLRRLRLMAHELRHRIRQIEQENKE